MAPHSLRYVGWIEATYYGSGKPILGGQEVVDDSPPFSFIFSYAGGEILPNLRNCM